MGGNAADAAVAAMVAVSVIQPSTCGIGGDCHALFYKKTDKKIYAINGSGRSGRNATLEKLKSVGVLDTTQREFYNHGLWVSVPGAVAGMCKLVEMFGSGKLTLNQIFTPAIKLAEDGVPIPQKTAFFWDKFNNRIKSSKQYFDLSNHDRPPLPGEKIHVPKLAQCFKLISQCGAEAFYTGEIAENIINEVHCAGGVLTLDDMKEHLSNATTNEIENPLYMDFYGFRVWEMKPNTIGIVVLVALNILQQYDLKILGHNTAEYVHIVSEAIKLAYSECWSYLCDPKCNSNFKSLLSEDVALELKLRIDMNKVGNADQHISGGNTSYVAAVDKDGNGCSFICSVFSHFGACLIPENCGFVLHDRLKCMNLNENSPNVYGPNKLPLHTIIPSMITDINTSELLAVLGFCGRWMQPQGRIQVLLNMIVYGMDPQTALDQPRFYVGNPRTLTHYNESLSMLTLEEGIELSIIPYLEQKGHVVKHSISGSNRILFGKGNIIAKPQVWNKNTTHLQNSWWAAADPRTDGSAMGY